MSTNTRGPQDAEHVRTGKDGALFLVTETEAIPFSEVNEFRITMTHQNVDWHPVNDSIVYAVPAGLTFSLSFNETVVRDDIVVQKVLEGFKESGIDSKKIWFAFMTTLQGRNGSVQRIKLDKCVPDGDVDLINITPGEIVQRNWSFRVNKYPELLEQLMINY